jgi:hypothetical protein
MNTTKTKSKTGNASSLNNSIWATLRPSNYGVGVFAIRDIPELTILSYYSVHTLDEIEHYNLSKEEFNQILPEIQELILDRTVFPKDCKEYHFISPNCNYTLSNFFNHSDDENCDGVFTTRDIKKGEEITINYKKLFPSIGEENKKHFTFL